ncbi:hypothetical protein NEHOM01_1793 [Nematocida homosporus]|uniref:uncharacterized protein n=1 Tax=Nematocida homosporus TaxID=1912981 RepID=UPI0022202A2A|nr:uncharacterized protein NEHOM01_1793 [Nematocida homosporus]KAI5186909.1 hypothetical protein NEHOM01_1793 [Nematocida homosporus]
MTELGFLALFHKHFQMELSASPELQTALSRINWLRHFWGVRRVVEPSLLAAGGAVLDTVHLAVGSASLLTDLLQRSSQRAWEGASGLAYYPISRVGQLVHWSLLRTGRQIWTGQPYRSPLHLHPWLRDNQTHSASLPQLTSTYVPAVLSSAKYEDLLQRYSPEAWRTLKTTYSVGELLAIRSLIFPNSKQSHPKISFIADLYNESKDQILSLKSTWTLVPNNNRYQIHQVQAEHMHLH